MHDYRIENGVRVSNRIASGQPCVHLGVATGETRPCNSCGARGEIVPLRKCSKYGVCYVPEPNPNVHLPGVQRCSRACPGYEPLAPVANPGLVRHLLYHVYPKRGDVWRWNVEKLKRRLSLFNGRRVVGIAVGPETESASAVKALLPGCEFVEVQNVPGLRETTYLPMLERVAEFAGPEHATFYGHTKGVSSQSWAPSVRRWAEAMYSGCLDHWPAVRRLLCDFPLAGAFKRRGGFGRRPDGRPESAALWHYSGGFRWVRNADLFRRDWRRVDDCWIGAESHPGLHFHVDEAGCLFGEFSDAGMALYGTADAVNFWRDKAGPEVERWHEEHLSDRWTPLLLTCILTSHQKPRTVHEAIASVLAQTCGDWQLIVMDSGELAGEFDRYRSDPRVLVATTGETPDIRGKVGIQAWAINECHRRGLVRGDLVCHLCDDDVFDPGIFAAWLTSARQHPEQQAWYGPAERTELREGGEAKVGDLATVGPTRKLDCIADGMQACVRTALAVRWPEEPAVAWHADGVWLDAVGAKAVLHPIAARVGRHRHCADSVFTRPSI